VSLKSRKVRCSRTLHRDSSASTTALA
jgi:hypothetical protein